MELVRPLLELQAAWSRIPAPGELLIERVRYRGVHHAFVFAFAGRLAHEGLCALVAHRLTRRRPCSISMTGNDYGFELVSREPFDLDEAAWRAVLSPRRLLDDLLECMNATQLARRRFRDIAQIAGLVFPGYPGEPKTARQIQASSDLFFEVFREHDPGNLLLDQARREVLEREMEVERLRRTLERLEGEAIRIVDLPRFTPLSFPLWVDHLRQQQASSETWEDRVQRMAAQLERTADRELRGGRQRRRAARRGEERDLAHH